MKLYIGCSLTQAPEDFKQKVERAKDSLREKYEILDFIGLVNGTANDVYNWDIHTCVATCDVFVAIVDLPSIGLGYELGVAIEKLEKPTLILAHQDAKVTRLVLGIEKQFVKMVRYSDPSEIPGLIEDFIKTRFADTGL